MREIPASEMLDLPQCEHLDVRAEVEFTAGHLPGARNIPLLTSEERHEVGRVYKEQGQDAALALGHRLVDPHRDSLVTAWAQYLRGLPIPLLTCFRGGLRSKISQQWIAEAGLESARVRGGYKALRGELLRDLGAPFEGFVIAGLTGVNKTGILQSLASSATIDLEALAHHRGSAFGGLFQTAAPPAQQSFENALGIALRRARAGHRRLVFEDESRLIGRCVLPNPFFDHLRALPRVVLEDDDAGRVSHIFEIYVAEPLRRLPAVQVEEDLVRSLHTLHNRLGGLLASEIEISLRAAFHASSPELHHVWIERLLHEYYDRLYQHAMQQQEQKPVFRGDAESVRQFLREEMRQV